MPKLSHLMRRAWSLLRQSMQPFSRGLFGTCLRRAWAEAKSAPVTPYATLQRVAVVPFGAGRDEAIRNLELARDAAKARLGLYRHAFDPASWSAAKHRSADICRLGNIEAILAREVAARDGRPA